MKLNTNTFKTLILLVGSILLMANRGGSPGGRTGSSTDGGTCATNGGCHGPKTPITQDMISTSVPASGYIPGETYTFTILAKKTGVQVWGFEMMCEDSQGDPVGKFDTTGNMNVTGLQDLIRVTHKFVSTSSNDSVSWTVDWVAPATGTGDIDIYCAVLATNNSNTNGGDNVYIDTLTISENTAVSVAERSKLELKIYPNPVLNTVRIIGEVSKNATIKIFNSEMKQIQSVPFQNELDLSELASGIYLIQVQDQNAIFSQKVFKN